MSTPPDTRRVTARSIEAVTPEGADAGATGSRVVDPGAADARVVVLGAAADIHRALDHPAVASGRMAVVSSFAVDVETGLDDADREAVELLFDRIGADGILLAGPVGHGTVRWASDVAMGHDASLWAVMPSETPAAARPRVVGAPDAPLVELTRDRTRRFSLAIKRAIDVLGALAGLALTAPLIAVLAALVRLDSRGAPIFRHARVGRGGRRFGCLKLRTMYADAEQRLVSDPELYAVYRANGYKIPEKADPRITPLGRKLRRMSLDELPQLWNVLVGDMSLVGPRPLVPEELEHYPGARCRLLLSVRPGLTGEWAVGGRHALTYPLRAEVELGYVRQWSLARDAAIVTRTIRAIRTY